MTSRPREYVRQRAREFETELCSFLGIPSVSTEPRHRSDIMRAARWLEEHLVALGFDRVELVETPGHPIVFARHDVDPEAPTVLLYGHYDVQPADPLDQWHTPPFEPARRDGRLYARGAVDDKGQLHMHLKAWEAFRFTGTPYPVNLRVVCEGEEEVGSPHLGAFVSQRVDDLRCDGVIISDSEMLDARRAAIEIGFRGIVHFEIHVEGAAGDLHSGVYGGAVVNPATVLCRILGDLHDGRGRVAMPGFYDQVRGLTAREQSCFSHVPFDEVAFLAGAGTTHGHGEVGFSSRERVWCRPSLDVHSLAAGSFRSGMKTIIPRDASAKLSVRLVPDQTPGMVGRALEEFVSSRVPEGARVRVQRTAEAKPWSTDPDGVIYRSAVAAVRAVFDAPPLFTRGGGSIPIVPTLQEALDAPVLLLGFGLPGGNPHAPNEWLDLEVYQRGIEALVEFYTNMGPSQ